MPVFIIINLLKKTEKSTTIICNKNLFSGDLIKLRSDEIPIKKIRNMKI